MQKTVLITGASEGIGRSFAKAFASQGFKVVAVARNEQRLQSLVNELGAKKNTYFVADLSSREDSVKLGHFIKTEKINILVNNAGVGGLGDFATSSIDGHIKMLHLNMESLVYLSHVFLNSAQRGDALINVASILAYTPSPYHSLYAATKAFVKSFSESLWYEQKKKDVYVMALCPGATATEFNSRAGGAANRIPRMMLQTSEDVVHTALKELTRRKKPVVITGTHNKLLALFSRLTPGAWLVSASGRQAEKHIST